MLDSPNDDSLASTGCDWLAKVLLLRFLPAAAAAVAGGTRALPSPVMAVDGALSLATAALPVAVVVDARRSTPLGRAGGAGAALENS